MDIEQIKQLVGKRIQDDEKNIYDIQYIGVYVATLGMVIVFIQPNRNNSVQVRPLWSFFNKNFKTLDSPINRIEESNEMYHDIKNDRKYLLIANGHLISSGDLHVYVSIYKDVEILLDERVLVRNWNVFNDGRNRLIRP